MISFSSRATFDKPATLVCLTSEQVKGGKFSCSLKEVSNAVNGVLAAGRFEGGRAEALPVIVGERLVVLVGLGKAAELTPVALRTALRRALLLPYLKKLAHLELVPHEDTEDVIRAVIDAQVLGTYAWKKYVSKKKDDTTVEKKSLCIVASVKPVYADAIKVAACVNFTRDLVNENADLTTAVYLADTVRALVKGKPGIKLEVLGLKELQARKMGLLLAVNKGSAKEPRVVIVRYACGRKNDPYIALVGKGLTYDTGGLNLKPTGSMETMRSDMSGAAAVIGALKAALELKIKKNIIFAFGAAENAIDANAYKPGDVFISYSGKSVEIGNTDAEGRLVLADVISYVIDNYKPACLVDLATLTGACVSALGHQYAGLMSNNDALADAVLASAVGTNDEAWRLPMYPELRDMIKSRIADIRNISNQRGAAGTMTAAEFLRAFVGETPWVHLDIAGTAFVDGDSRTYYTHGATGYGVRLLADLLRKN